MLPPAASLREPQPRGREEPCTSAESDFPRLWVPGRHPRPQILSRVVCGDVMAKHVIEVCLSACLSLSDPLLSDTQVNVELKKGKMHRKQAVAMANHRQRCVES